MNDSLHFRGLGASSILMIFVLLCLTTFGVLSLVSAQADRRLTQKAAEATLRFYEADADADRLLQQVDVLLFEARREARRLSFAGDGEIESLYPPIVRQRLASIASLESSDGTTATFLVPMDDSRRLCIQLTILPPDDTARYEVISRRVIAEDSWEAPPPQVWPGE